MAVPNGVWSRNVVAALAAQGVRAETLPDAQPLRGDIRDNARCVPARIATALNLAANPDDAVAWRCWCGFGDYLVNSAALANLRSRSLPSTSATTRWWARSAWPKRTAPGARSSSRRAG